MGGSTEYWTYIPEPQYLNPQYLTLIPEPQYLTQILKWMWILNVSTLYLSANLYTQFLILNLNTWMWIPDMTTWIWYWMWVPKHKPEYWAWIPKYECPYLNLNTWTQTPGIWLFDGLVIWRSRVCMLHHQNIFMVISITGHCSIHCKIGLIHTQGHHVTKHDFLSYLHWLMSHTIWLQFLSSQAFEHSTGSYNI